VRSSSAVRRGAIGGAADEVAVDVAARVSGVASMARAALLARGDVRTATPPLPPVNPAIPVMPALLVMIANVRAAMARVGRMGRTVRPRCCANVGVAVTRPGRRMRRSVDPSPSPLGGECAGQGGLQLVCNRGT
jgi:hypothetical protein